METVKFKEDAGFTWALSIEHVLELIDSQYEHSQGTLWSREDDPTATIVMHLLETRGFRYTYRSSPFMAQPELVTRSGRYYGLHKIAAVMDKMTTND